MDFLKQAVSEYASGNNQNQNQGQNHQGQGQGQGQYQNDNENQYQQNQGQGGENRYNNQNAPGGYGGQGEYNSQQGEFGGQGQGQQQGGSAAGFFGKTGGEEFNRPHGSGGSGGNGNFGGLPNVDQSSAMQAANDHAGQQDSGLFSSAMGFLQNMNKDDKDDVDEDDVMQKHDEAYNKGNAGGMSANSMGTAAAMQAMKMFTSGQGSGGTSSGGNMQSKMIGMAMSEAAKMFDQNGGGAGGNKQDAVNSAGATIMKLLLKSQFSGTTGGANSGGLSSMMSMASKFM